MKSQKLIFTYEGNTSEAKERSLFRTPRGYYSVERVNVEGGISIKILEDIAKTAEIFTSPNPAKRIEFSYLFD